MALSQQGESASRLCAHQEPIERADLSALFSAQMAWSQRRMEGLNPFVPLNAQTDSYSNTRSVLKSVIQPTMSSTRGNAGFNALMA